MLVNIKLQNNLDELIKLRKKIKSSKLYQNKNNKILKIFDQINIYMQNILKINQWQNNDYNNYFDNIFIWYKDIIKDIPEFIINFYCNDKKVKDLILVLKDFNKNFRTLEDIIKYMSYMYDKINIQEIKKSNLKEKNKNLNKYRNISFNKNDIDVILYHKFCNDGYGSVFAIEKYYLKNNLDSKSIIKKGLKPNWDINEKIIKGKKVVICDLSLSEENFNKIKKLTKDLLIIDHHLTTIKNTKNIEDNKKIIDTDHSGAYLTWEYFNSDEEIPDIIKYIEDHDLWRFKLYKSRELYSSLKEVKHEYEEYEKLLDLNNLKEKIKLGDILYNIEMNKIKKIAKNAVIINQRIKTINSSISKKLYKIAYINSNSYNNELGNYMVEKKNCDISIIYNYSDIKNTTYMSLRSNNKNDIDVSKIAEIYNGGGHKHASSFEYNGFKNRI